METLKKYGTYLLSGIIVVLGLVAVIFQRREKPVPEADIFKGDRLEDQVNTAQIETQHAEIVETLKPSAPTKSATMGQAIDAWKRAGD